MLRRSLLDKLREARSRVSKGKERLAWYSLNPITATVPQLEELINQVSNASTLEGFRNLQQRVLLAVGIKYLII